MFMPRGSLAVWRKTLYRDALRYSVRLVVDQEEGREGDGQRSQSTGPVWTSTQQRGSQKTQMASCSAHHQPSRRTALDDDTMTLSALMSWQLGI